MKKLILLFPLFLFFGCSSGFTVDEQKRMSACIELGGIYFQKECYDSRIFEEERERGLVEICEDLNKYFKRENQGELENCEDILSISQ